MLVNQAVQLVVLATAVLWSEADAAPSAFRVCGRNLSEFMTRVCNVYNSPSWDVPTVVEQPASAARRRRASGGISDCCTYGCTWEQLSEYCSEVNDNTEPLSPNDSVPHDIKRSAEDGSARVAGEAPAPAAVAEDKPAKRRGAGARREVGGGRRDGGYGRARRRCGCRRRRRAGTKRATFMGNTGIMVENATRGPPSIGTVSPLLTWGRTLNTALPQFGDRDRYSYVAVYST